MNKCKHCANVKYKTLRKGKPLRYDKCPYPWEWACKEEDCKNFKPKWYIIIYRRLAR